MMTKQKMRLCLALLLFLEAALLFQQFGPSDLAGSKRIFSEDITAPAKVQSVSRKTSVLRLDLLQQGLLPTTQPTINIFRALVPKVRPKPKIKPRPIVRPVRRARPKPPPPPPRRQVVVQRPPPPLRPAPPRGPSAEEIAARKAKAALAQAQKALGAFVYLGYLEQNGAESAFLSKGNELYIVAADEEIEAGILLKELTITSLVVQEKQTGAELRLSLTESK